MKTMMTWTLAAMLMALVAWQVMAQDTAAPAPVSSAPEGVKAPPDDAPPPPPGEHRGDRPDRPRGKGGMVGGPMGGMGGEFREDDEDIKLSEEEIKQAAAILRDYRPDLADRFEAMRKSDPDHAVRMLGRFPFVRRLMMAKETDPQAYALQLEDVKLNAEAERIAREIREGSGGEAQLKQLHDVVQRHFDIRQQLREHTLKRLEEKITSLREQIQKRAASRDELIQSREQELIGQSRNPQW